MGNVPDYSLGMTFIAEFMLSLVAFTNQSPSVVGTSPARPTAEA